MSIYQQLNKAVIVSVVCLGLLLQAGSGLAVDTDIYQAAVKNNAYILLDSSGSMAWGVYESSIDYGAMYDYLVAKSNIEDDGSPVFPIENFVRNKIYMVRGRDIGLSMITIDGEDRAFHGDAASDSRYWYVNDVVDLHTILDSDGSLVPEEGQVAGLTTNAEGHVLYDDKLLPLGQDRLLRDPKVMFDGTVIDEGFGGLLNAPGYYFSGYLYEGTDYDKKDLYFFVTGNWLNMQHVYNLDYVGGNTPVWKYESFPTGGTAAWTEVAKDIGYPEGDGNYVKGMDVSSYITQHGAAQIQVHFSEFDVDGDGDSVRLYDGKNKRYARYDNDNNPKGKWSATIPGNKVRIRFRSDTDKKIGKGYTIDKIRYIRNSDSYRIQSRLEVAQESLLAVIDDMRGKINWGFASFKNGDGAQLGPLLNPAENDDTNRAAIARQVELVQAGGGTPLGEALQDVFEKGFYGRRNILDKLLCRRNYVIAVSDGFPSSDTDWSRIDGKTFSDEDSDGFTADPAQYTDPDDNYYDDVANWMYKYSWRDKNLIPEEERANSFENVVSHQIAFGSAHALMEDAAEEAGGEYITVYNKDQLVNAFQSLALMISESISFTAPVVSVDAANKVQNGDDLYMGQFLPMDAGYWPGNLKKFVLGDGSAQRPDRWTIYDGNNNEATDSNGMFLDNTGAFWGDDNDANDVDSHGAPDIREDGAGEVLTERVAADFSAGSYYARSIKTYLSGSVVPFDRSIDPGILALAAGDTVKRDKIVNWVYGYTFDADAVAGNPVALRDWALGPIVHSRPTVIDYYKTSDFSQIEKRYVVAGADDGMLHVFDDTDGSEVLAFVPPDVLPKLKNYETVLHQPLVDGPIKLYRENGHPKYLIFGLRRGGASYWALDISDLNPANWTVAWSFEDSEMTQSWSEVEIAKIRTGTNTFTPVAVFSGGYDQVEDNFPEPFNDLDGNGTPFAANGTIDSREWDKADGNQDVYNNNLYDRQNPGGDSNGRAVYVVDVATGTVLFSVKNGASDNPSKGSASTVTTQTRTDFRYCFPASPSVVSLSMPYSYDAAGEKVTARESNVLAAIYAPDIYGNLFRITYDYADGNPTWQVRHLFSANPGSSSGSGKLWAGTNSDDVGRKVFYGPAVSWRGAGRFFDPSNYYYPGTTFNGTKAIASLYFGTGDREHPTYQMVQDRVYALYDDLPVSAASGIAVTSAPYTEDDLLNLSCDELGRHTAQAGKTPTQTAIYKTGLNTLLTDDVLNITTSDPMEAGSGGNGENDAKGWYIILEDQGLSSECSHCDYEATVDSSKGGRDYHVGEKILGKLTLYAGNLYFTSYQPVTDNPCNPQGNAFNYALNYLDGSAALNLNYANDAASGDDRVKKDVTDRYGKHKNVRGLPSGFEPVVRGGEAVVMSSVGGGLIKHDAPGPDSGISLYYWIER